MKNTMMKSLICSGLALAVAAAVWSPILASAEQLKGGQVLVGKSAPAVTAATAPGQPMACAQCKDEFTSAVDWTARGAIKPVVAAQKHLCGACKTSLKTTEAGKHSTQVATHTCSMGGNELASCCK
jgi:hypothetical protein